MTTAAVTSGTMGGSVTYTGCGEHYPVYFARGHAPFGGRFTEIGFNTTLSPNSPQCAIGSTNASSYPSGVYPPSSNHTGGVNIVRADGSGGFITNSISTVTQGTTGLSSDQVTSGRSPYGVWGALGSINGGESVSL